jgi:hypothetical protein
MWAKALDPADAAAFGARLKAEGYGPLVVHAPYVYNLAGKDEAKRAFAIEALAEDIELLTAIREAGQEVYINIHPGAHVGQRGRVRDVGQVALGRRRALDLGDHGDAVGALKPSCRVNRSRGRQRGLLHILKRYGELTGALILQRSRHQFVQNRHGPPFVGVRSCATLGHVLSRLPNPSYILGFRRRFRLRQNIGINWHACADVLRSTWNGTPWLDRTIDGASLLAGVRNSGTALSRRLQFHEVAPLQGDGKRLIQPLDSTEPMRLF